MMQSLVADCALRARTWLFNNAIPLWLDRGVDRARGGVFDALDPVKLENCVDYKRLRVATRQIYVFAQAARHHVDGAADIVDQLTAYMLQKFRHPDGGFSSRCDLDGNIIDPVRDLYDLAFTLFALAHAYDLLGNPSLLEEARELLAFIDREMRHPSGGFVEAIPPAQPRRQNPHMHLLEAALAWVELAPTAGFEALSDDLVRLCTKHFLDLERGLLFEFFDDSLTQPDRATGLAVVEPGHHFEWAWLLDEYRRLRGKKVDGGNALSSFALRYGHDAQTGLLHAECYEDGSVAQRNVRLWPHGEWVKAALALNGDAGDPVAAWNALERFLDTPTRGMWHEHWNAAENRFIEGPSPATSLYHITTAVMALQKHAA